MPLIECSPDILEDSKLFDLLADYFESIEVAKRTPDTVWLRVFKSGLPVADIEYVVWFSAQCGRTKIIDCLPVFRGVYVWRVGIDHKPFSLN